MKTEDLNEQGDFEKRSLNCFETLLHGYRRAKNSGIGESEADSLEGRMTHLPTDPFSRKLMKLFNYDYLVLSESIENIIEKALRIRDAMQDRQRFVQINEQYYRLPLLPKDTFLKKLEVYNNEGELCYVLKGRLQVSFTALCSRVMHGKNKSPVFSLKKKTEYHKKLEIYYYSDHVTLSSTDREDYYNFFCDYFGKLQFLKYLNARSVRQSVSACQSSSFSPKAFDGFLRLTAPRQVLWVYFLFRLMGLKLRVNAEIATMTRFLHILNHMNIEDYKNSYFYKLASKAPYVKDDRHLLKELEFVKISFQKSNLPTGDIEKEIVNLVTN